MTHVINLCPILQVVSKIDVLQDKQLKHEQREKEDNIPAPFVCMQCKETNQIIYFFNILII